LFIVLPVDVPGIALGNSSETKKASSYGWGPFLLSAEFERLL
jgi:hypothetical protein